MTTDEIPKPTVGRGIPIPWGLFVALGLYALCVYGYIWHTYWQSPDYQAAEHYQAAWAILGEHEGRKSTKAELETAYRHLLEAGRLKPEVKTFHDDLQSLNWRFDEKKWKVPQGLRNSAEAVAVLWQRIQQERRPMLVVGLRDKGWAPEQLLAGPETVAKWSVVPGLFIVALWGYGRFNAKRIREQDREQDLVEQERELRELGRFRDGLDRPSGERPAQAPRRRRPPRSG